MKVIICGAGQVGQSIARYLCQQDNDVTIIDQSEDLVSSISSTLDVRGITGFASHPDVLAKAGIAEAEMLIGVTYADEVNMVACQIAHSLFNVPMKIARVRHRSYLDPEWANLYKPDHLPIDLVISPEYEVAQAISHGLEVPGAFEVVPFADGLVNFIGIRCKEKSPLMNTPLSFLGGLFPDLEMSVMCIIRGDDSLIPDADTVFLPGDEVYLLVRPHQMNAVIEAFGYEKESSHRLLVLGGGNVGLCLTQELEHRLPHVNTLVIEQDKERAVFIANQLSTATVLRGDCLDKDILLEAGADKVDTVVAVSSDDKVNILASLLTKRIGAKQAWALINSPAYPSLVTSLGVDSVISPRSLTVSKILQFMRRGRIVQLHSLRDGHGEIVEAEALGASNVLGKTIGELSIPGKLFVGALIREGEALAPKADTVVKVGDHLIIMATADAVAKFERMFSVRLGYFN